MISRILIVAAILATMSPVTDLRAQAVARFLEVHGSVVIRAAGGDQRPAVVYGAVAAGDRLVLADAASLVLAWPASGELQRVAGAGEATAREVALETGPGITVTKLTPPKQEIVAKGVKELGGLPSGATSITRGSIDRPIRPSIAPISGSTVLSVEPAFSWPSDGDAVHYRLRLSTTEGQLWQGDHKQTKVSYPSTKPLERGLSYQWIVTAALPNKAEKPIAEGEFTVAVESEAREATELQSLAATQDEFLMSLVALRLEQQDLIAEAIAVYEKLAKLATKTPAYHAALAELYGKAGRTKDASDARGKATKLGFKFD